MNNPTSSEQPFEVAVVGGGIIGLSLVLGLLERNIKVKLYEQTSAFNPIGAGIGLTPNAVRALRLLSPKALEAQQKVTTANGDPKNPNDWLMYLDGYHVEEAEEKLLFQLYSGYRGFEGCVRSDLVNQLVQLIPEEIIHLGKRLKHVEDRGDDEKVLLEFEDGSTAEADAVIGCDGIKSKVRRIMFGVDHPCVEPGYNNQYALRGLIPMSRAVEALGEYKAHNRHMHLGPGSHVVTIPVALGKMVNIVAFIPDHDKWSNGSSKLTAVADKEEVVKAFSHFGAPVRGIIQALVETSPTLNKWAIFDMYENPAPTYAKGRICLSGDAAHASSPHHGAGVGMGIEDNLALCTVLDEGLASVSRGEATHGSAVRAAWTAFDLTRRERTQWLVSSSRVIGEVLEWRYEDSMDDFDKCLQELTWRSHKIWNFDEKAMVQSSIAEYKSQIETRTSQSHRQDSSKEVTNITIVPVVAELTGPETPRKVTVG